MAADKPAQYIVDSSSILSYILPDETLTNSIRSIIKTGKIYSNFLGFPIQYLSPNYHDTLDISLRYDLSFYDASYLSLALKKTFRYSL
ncbi:hypothetical protein AUJ42_02520 [Candidatus Collierbacteria bacterium CG1_02_44_10]|uniref:PIN domain-containing protein n=4 Tax=Candidatus Collieribacteriota TaxID=1752725 RepID=A0A2H0DTM1_9BACT|nr:type II toxin-antitoxin system VapC family toxin [bacterium]OIN90936.1 MAG: hypothetical protein AUJ42_02520 [Candidatus Collierbacteria bacterium CG1_02_44_10]PIP85526.1 MAG: hypothetical protein COW83_03845 [Candidatus Collierbacteria bacterium CG22_combo_CG10-13_8_21_14_all_43_12]PIR99832.1 MAG: hypothetical protein COT86_01855 [Candidatus Collierbacteria bacterium CG10_big_fil_rev_8_21_14_0_10_43_36]PIZ24716.1 MAG: hypothetical protein COY48_01520 [Candidatus Collierbacteria bacterium CG